MGQGSRPGYSQEVTVAVCCHSAQAEAASHKSDTQGQGPRGPAAFAVRPVWHGDQVNVLMTKQSF